MNVVIVSFATSGSPYRDYSKRIQDLRDYCNKYRLILEIYDVQRVISSSHYIFSNNYFSLRRGVGYWHWKPIVLLDAHDLHPNALIIYLDIDFDLLRIPKDQLRLMNTNKYSLALFRTHLNLKDCSSSVFWSNLSPKKETKMIIASIIIANFSVLQTIRILKRWAKLNDEPSLLLDPIYEFNTRHRHDKSILSYVAHESKEHILFMEDGYWSESKEAYNMNKEKSWVRMHQNDENINIFEFNRFLVSIKFYLWSIMNRVKIFRFYHDK